MADTKVVDLSKATGTGYFTLSKDAANIEFKDNAASIGSGVSKVGRVVETGSGYQYAALTDEGRVVKTGATNNYWTINLGSGADTVTVTADASGAKNGGVINASSKATSIVGGANFTITTGAGADTISAAANDTVRSGAGADSIALNGAYIDLDAGADNDTITGTSDYATVKAGAGDDSIVLGGKYVSIDAGSGKDYVSIGGAESTVFGGADDDTIVVGADATNAVIDGGAGADSITSAANGVTITAGAGKDTISVSGKDWVVDAGADDDSLNVSGTGTVTLGAGKDSVAFGAADVTFTDYNYNDDTLEHAAIEVKADSLAKTFGTDGKLALANSLTATFTGKDGVYAAKFVDGGTTAAYVWTGETGAVADGSKYGDALTMVGANNDDVADTLIGGAKNDTIYAGTGDYVYGGAGDDSIVIADNATGVTVSLKAAGGNDTVKGFTASFGDDADKVFLSDSYTALSFESVDGALKVKDGKKASVTLNGVTVSDSTSAKVKVENGGKEYNVQVFDGTQAALDGEAKAVYGISDAANGFNYTADADAAIDLSNSGSFGDSRYYTGITQVTVTGAADTTLVGGKAAETLTAAGDGDASLWGGQGNDSLVGSGSGSKTFFYGAGDGLDTISGYSYSATDGERQDVVDLYSGNLTKWVRNDSDDIELTFGSNKQKLTVQMDNKDTDAVFAFATGLGGETQLAKISKSSAAASFTYDDSVNFYVGTKAQTTDTLTVSSEDDTNIWLDGSNGKYFESIEVVDASASTGNVTLAGGKGNETLTAGSGNASLWGGQGGNDVLNGGYGETTFFFGKNNGKDTIVSNNASDKVVLYDVALTDITKIGAITEGSDFTVKLADSSQFTIKSFSSGTANTFQLKDGSTWSYDFDNKNWKAAE